MATDSKNSSNAPSKKKKIYIYMLRPDLKLVTGYLFKTYITDLKLVTDIFKTYI